MTQKFAVLEQPFFVSFAQILDQMRENAALLWASTLSSLGLWLISFVIGTLLGILLGLGMGRYRQFNYWAFPYLKVIGIIPAAAWMPLTMVIFPTSYMAEVFLIAFSVWFPVAFMTIGGVQGISKEYFESARTLGFSEWQIIRKIVLPGALPSIFTGVYTAMGLSFTMLVISEMIGAKVGLGWFINWAKGTGNYTQVYAAIVIMAILFSVLFAVFTKVQDYCLRWRDSSH
nr:ABC transporter permease subunit [Lactiplantibacillus pentosus]